MNIREAASAGATTVLVACAIAVTGLAFKKELTPAPQSRRQPQIEKQLDYLKYASEGNRIGSADAKAVMVEFSDFQCPACRQMEDRLRESLRKFPNDFAIVYRHFPLPSHKYARPAALASECAAAQGRFREMHNALFDMRDSIGTVPWTRYASAAGVTDTVRFSKCLADSSAMPNIERDVAAATELKVSATPTMMINGVRIRGTLSQVVLDSLVKDAVFNGKKTAVVASPTR